ncbi:MAG: hypothetical protein VX777_02520 [Chlamydiota bacterium]|nr:hypothetical protein [Chlamydiota bacterium]
MISTATDKDLFHFAEAPYFEIDEESDRDTVNCTEDAPIHHLDCNRKESNQSDPIDIINKVGEEVIQSYDDSFPPRKKTHLKRSNEFTWMDKVSKKKLQKQRSEERFLKQQRFNQLN